MNSRFQTLVVDERDFTLDRLQKLLRQLASHMSCRWSLERQVDKLQLEVQAWHTRWVHQQEELARLRHELNEWESWNSRL